MTGVPEKNEINMDRYREYSNKFCKGCHCHIEDQNSLQDSHWGSCPRYCSTCSSGIKLELTGYGESGCSFRKTVILVIVLKKLKKGTGKLFMDTDLLDLLNDICMEGKIACRNSESTLASPPSFHYLTSNVYRIKDTSNKSFVVRKMSNKAHLVALTLQGMNIRQEDTVNIAVYVTQPFNSRQKPVALGFERQCLYLSCKLREGLPALYLEEVKNIKDIQQNDLLRYIFLNNANGTSEASTQSFESAAFPGWYISTSQKANELIKMVPQHDQSRIKDFKLFKIM